MFVHNMKNRKRDEVNFKQLRAYCESDTCNQLRHHCFVTEKNPVSVSSREQIAHRLQLIPYIARLLPLGDAVDFRAALQQLFEPGGGMPGKG